MYHNKNQNPRKMKKISFFLVAFAMVAIASCTSDQYAGGNDIPGNNTLSINFESGSKGMTRADATGAEAAALLGKQFVVSGYKGTNTQWADGDNTIVFDNYVVKYTENSAYTTESNTRNWEYVGQKRIKHAIDNGITRQSTKYWDYTKAQYDFIAWSTGTKKAIYEGTPGDGEVLVSAITPATAVGANGVAYTMRGASNDLNDCYVADIVTVKKAQYGDNPVTIKFRSLGSKVRIGLYETVPGYSVRDVKFYDAAASALKDEAVAENITYNNTPRLFTAKDNIYTNGKFTIYYTTVDNTDSEDNNQAHIRFEPIGTQSTLVNFSGMNYTIAEDGEKTPGKVFLGRSSATATMAGEAEGNYYTQYLPNEGGTNLNLRVNYTLESIDGSGETIEVKGATAQVPAIYAQWKSGFAYTYLFKSSDKTNGHTGNYNPLFPDDVTVNSDPAGLYPITFDAMIVDDETTANTQETITLVSTPSITTYQKGSTVVNDNEYKAATGDIFVTVNDGTISYEVATTPASGESLAGLYTKSGDVYTPCNPSATSDGTGTYYRMKTIIENGDLTTLTDKAALYTIPAGKTEADVIDALSMRDDDADEHTIKGRSGLVLTEATFTLTNKIEYGVDGNAINITTDQALRFTPEADKTYAFVYTKTAPNAGNDVVKYEALNWADFATGQTKYRYDYKNAEGSFCKPGVKYFSEASGTHTMITAFVGQDVSNLYVKDGENYVIASGLVVPGTTYYYTTDHGMSYKECKAVSYKTARAAGKLYTLDGTTYTAKEAGTPVNGTAYYYKEGEEYIYAVIYPQLTESLYELDTTKYVKATETAEVVGQTYFDMYTKNNGVYYTKVIKVQD